MDALKAALKGNSSEVLKDEAKVEALCKRIKGDPSKNAVDIRNACNDLGDILNNLDWSSDTDQITLIEKRFSILKTTADLANNSAFAYQFRTLFIIFDILNE